MWPLKFHTSNPVSEMDESHTRGRSPTFGRLLLSYCCCYGSDDVRSPLRPSWFQKVRRSIPRVDSVSGDSQNWWGKGWNSVKIAGESSESVTHDAGSCCSGTKWKQLFRGLKKDSKIIRSSKHSRFNYDPLSYELNFDDGSRRYEHYQLQGLSLSAVKPGESAGALLKLRRLNPREDSVHAGEWSESVTGDEESCCNCPRWKHFVRRFKADGRNICGPKPSKFQYDLLSYELNFDDGSRLDDHYQHQGSSLSAIKPGMTAGAL